MENDDQLVFMSYTVSDKDRVEPIVNALMASGINAWMDCKRLKAGQNWDFEIRKALDKALFIVIFISEKSVTKRGYVQRELKLALGKAEEKLADDIYLIPVLLDQGCEVPELVKDLQFIKVWEESFQENLIDAVRHQLNRIGLAVEVAQNESQVSWSFSSYKELREGLPGFEGDFQFPRISSTKYPMVSQVGDIVKGDLLLKLSGLRFQTLSPDVELYNFGQDRYRRTHTLDATPQTPKIKGRMLSLPYWLHSYSAMAAHPNHHIVTYCFLVDPLCHISSLEMILDDPDAALAHLQMQVRSKLLNVSNDVGDDYRLDSEWVESGTQDWSAFSAFTFEDKGIEFHFAPYQVAAYAYGPQSALVLYEDISPFILGVFKSALDLQ